MTLLKRFFIVFFLGLNWLVVYGQQEQPSSSAILLKMKKLNVLGSALYFAAHPDDENTRLIGYLANGELVNAGYLALTRGDGGQNLIGPEMREGLGLIRTQELLAARRVDGSTQFFSRANDFGYSKTSKETLKIWDKDQVLHDAVWAIRKFRPDVIITRFPADSRAGHGHHTSSAIIAEEAFDIAASESYPEQLKYVQAWQPERLMLNTGRWWQQNIEELKNVVKVDIGQYSPELGESFSEAAARSRSMHKSQGFGSQGARGSSIEYLSLVKGSIPNSSIFEGIDITWNRVGAAEMAIEVANVISSYDPANPAASVEQLVSLHNKISKIDDDFWRQKKLEEVEQLILDCTGFFMAVWAEDYSVVAGSELGYNVEIVNRSPIAIKLASIALDGIDTVLNTSLENNQRYVIPGSVVVGTDHKYSGPYWLEEEPLLGMYVVNDLELIGRPENKPPLSAKITLEIAGISISKEIPVTYHWTDRVNGEMLRPITIIPPAFVNLSNPVYIFNNGEQKIIDLSVEAGKDNLVAEVKLDVPEGWEVRPEVVSISIEKKGTKQSLQFMVTPSANRSGMIEATIKVDGESFNRSKYEIQYLHIPYKIMLPKAVSRAENLQVVNMAQTVGYIMGAGDNVPEGLEQMGVKVWMMNESDLTIENLQQIDAVVFGIRAANTLSWIPSKKQVLLDYMEKGGTVVMQYNTTRGLNWEDFAPYEIKFTGNSSDSRVAEETAEVSILNPEHKVLNYPNKIESADFDGWVQERGLYFPSAWDPAYQPILSAHDEDEEPKNGGLLIAEYGKGHFVYTGLSMFRELPAGVPGAYRLFSNILSLSKQIKTESVNLEESKKKRSRQK